MLMGKNEKKMKKYKKNSKFGEMTSLVPTCQVSMHKGIYLDVSN